MLQVHGYEQVTRRMAQNEKQPKLPSAFVLPRHILNKIPALDVGEMTSGKKAEASRPSPCPV